MSSAELKLISVQKMKSRQQRLKEPICQQLRYTYTRCETFWFIKMTMSSGLLLECNFQHITGRISFCRFMAILDLCCNTIVNKIYLQTFCPSQRAKMYDYVLQTTHTLQPQRFPSHNQNEQNQVIKDSCSKMWH